MRILPLLLAGLFLLATPADVTAQSVVGAGEASGAASAEERSPAALADERLRELIGTLEDPEARDRLIGNLESLLRASREQGGEPEAGDEGFSAAILDQAASAMGALSEQLVEAVGAFAELPSALAEDLGQLRQPSAQRRLLEVAATLLAIALGGLAAEYLVSRLLARPRRKLDDRPAESWAARLFYLLLRLLLDLVPIAAFAATTYGILTLSDTTRTTDIVALAFINANVLDRAVRLLGRILLVPQSRAQRLLPLEDETAHYLYVWLRRLSLVGIYGFMATEVALVLGLDPAAHGLLVDLLALLIAAMLVMFVLQQRREVAAWLGGNREASGALGGMRVRFAEIWHVLAIVYIAACYLIFLLDVENGFGFLARATLLSLLVVALARLAVQLVGRLIERGFRLDPETRQRFPLLEERLNRYQPVLRGILCAAVSLLALLLLFEIWGASPFEWLAGAEGRALVGQVLKIALVIGGSLALWEIASSLIESYLRGRPGGRSARATTLLGLFQNALRIVLAVLVVLVVLSELGLDIAPLLAGAGVVGLAVGFGAQTLVKDVITGVFMLMENTVAVGDVVEIAGHAGVVEQISIRTAHLRDLEGNIHVVPFSEVTSVTNYGRGFAYALVRLRIAYREDVDQVVETLREIAAGLREDEALKGAIVGDLEVLGVDQLDVSAVVVVVRMRTTPLMQWAVKREFQKRIKRVFGERGIEIPFPHQTIYFGGDKDGTAPPLHLASQKAPQDAPQPPEAEPAGSEGAAPPAGVAPRTRRRLQDLPDPEGDGEPDGRP